MRVNVYAEEMTTRVELVEKTIDGEGTFTGVRFYLELPVTRLGFDSVTGKIAVQDQVHGPFMHQPNDDDSAAVTFWGKGKLRLMLQAALQLLDKHEER